MDETTTTGTDPKDDATLLEQPGEGGTPEGEDRNAESEDWKKLAISLQEKAAKVNELEAKLKAFEERPGQPASPPEDDTAPKPGTFEYFVAAKDPVAQRQLQHEIQTRQELELLHMGLDKNEERQLRAFVKTQPGRFQDWETAHTAMTAPNLAEENRKLKEQLATLSKGPDPEVMKAPSTHGREISAAETKMREWTDDQFEREAARIAADKGPLAELNFRSRVGKDIRLKG